MAPPGKESPNGSCFPPCPGCNGQECSHRPAVLRFMAKEDLAPGFQRALESGWDAFWEFGLSAGNRLSAMDKPHAAYCLLLNIAAFGRFDLKALQEIKVNLERRLNRAGTAQNHQEDPNVESSR